MFLPFIFISKKIISRKVVLILARIKWEGNIENDRLDLELKGYKPLQIANILSEKYNIRITTDMVNGRKRTVNKGNNFRTERLFGEDLYEIKDKYILSEKTKKHLFDIWEKFNKIENKKMLVLSDLHAPYTNFEKLEQAINDNIDCNICILNGDILDGDCFSRFEKMKEINVEEEYSMVMKIFDILSSKFEYIVWVDGNHDGNRFKSYVIKNIKQSLRDFAYKRLNPVNFILENYNNIIAVQHNTLQIGDVIFKHPNIYSNAELKTVINEYDIFVANKNDLPNPNFRCICIGHTHYMGEYYKNDVKLMETGCLCHTPDYKFLNPSKRKWTIGYARIELDKNNKIIFNKSGVVVL